ncbi:hypothetical protein EAS64_25020 [Trebonia kvetii]|uniref:Uncharacterized protein n=1 Tax=Trebonia kvetii TaxID=2480626 RepID=A0A6P2BVD6_9ACTN|nr:hypothetical protein [Trebonia kvetii]TVZ02105.1 hypothetical protein EAS64_25020 [Trebonia kvetii]
MDDAAGCTSASTPRTSADQDVLAELETHWGESYIIGHDEERGWWAARRDVIGRFFTSPGPDELQEAIAGDYQAEPGQRDLSADGGNS